MPLVVRVDNVSRPHRAHYHSTTRNGARSRFHSAIFFHVFILSKHRPHVRSGNNRNAAGPSSAGPSVDASGSWRVDRHPQHPWLSVRATVMYHFPDLRGAYPDTDTHVLCPHRFLTPLVPNEMEWAHLSRTRQQQGTVKLPFGRFFAFARTRAFSYSMDRQASIMSRTPGVCHISSVAA